MRANTVSAILLSRFLVLLGRIIRRSACAILGITLTRLFGILIMSGIFSG